MTVESPKEKFLRLCPGGFNDPRYLKDERNCKWVAHEMWCELLNQEEFARLLAEDHYHEICRRVLKVEAKTKFMLSQFEKSALHHAIKGDLFAGLMAESLFDLVYGDDDFEKRLVEFATDLSLLPKKQTHPAKWTIATIFPFLAHPQTHIFLKPEVTQAAAKRRGFTLNYTPELNWLTYSSLLDFSEVLAKEVADLHPRDMIDIQSYIWVTEFYESDL